MEWPPISTETIEVVRGIIRSVVEKKPKDVLDELIVGLEEKSGIDPALPEGQTNPFEKKREFFQTRQHALDYSSILDQLLAYKELQDLLELNNIPWSDSMKESFKEVRKHAGVSRSASSSNTKNDPWITPEHVLALLAKEFATVYEPSLNKHYHEDPSLASPADFFGRLAQASDPVTAQAIFDAASVDSQRKATPAIGTTRVRRPWDAQQQQQRSTAGGMLTGAGGDAGGFVEEVLATKNVTPDEYKDVLLAGGFELLFPHLVPRMPTIPGLD